MADQEKEFAPNIEDYSIQHGIGHKKDRLYVHWDITTRCEYRCSYCYAQKQYEGKWNLPGPWKKQQEVLDEMSKSTLPIFLGLLGGEPTSHHRYEAFLDKVEESIFNHEDSRLYITSNGAKDFSNHRKSNGKMYMLWSYHPEYMSDAIYHKFLSNVLIMRSKGYKTKVNIMLHPDRQYWERIKDTITYFSLLNSVEVHPHFIYETQHKQVDYSDEFYKEFSYLDKIHYKEFVFEDSNGTVDHYSDIEVFRQGLNKFTGWKCHNNNYEIGLDCRIHRFCVESPHDITYNYFKDIKAIEPVICPHDFCSCDGLLKIRKELN